MMAAPRPRLIGVLGGMGPAATVDFFSKVIAATAASRDEEHVPLLIHSVPQIPSRTAAIARGDDAPLPAMLAGLRLLEGAGAEVLAIPCNTAHVWYDRLAAGVSVPVIHIADAVLGAIAARPRPAASLGVMATRATIAARLYHERLEAAGTRLIAPDEAAQGNVDAAIAAVKRGEAEAAAALAGEAAAALLAAGAEGLLLACTEIPVALARSPLRTSAIDATEALARACVAASLGPAATAARAGATARAPSPA